MAKNKKKNKQTSQASKLPPLPVHLVEQFDEAYELIRVEEWGDALDKLLDIEQARPDFPGIETALCMVAHEAGEFGIVERCFRKMAERSPNDLEVQSRLGSAYMLNNHLVLGYRHLSEFVAAHPDHEEAKMFREMLSDVEPEVDKYVAQVPLPRDEALTFLSIAENVEYHLSQQELSRAVSVAESGVRKYPSLGAAYILSAVAYLASSQLALAIDSARRGRELAPENARALAVLVRALVTAGRIDEAKSHAEGFSTVAINTADDLEKSLFALCFVGNEKLAIEVYERYGAAIEGALEIPLTLHFGATSYAVQGREQKARELWSVALKIDPEMSDARDNLKDLDREPGKRNGPYAFPLMEWLTNVAYRDILELRNYDGYTSEAAERAGRKIVRKHPELLGSVPHILFRCNDSSAALLINLVVMSGDQDLMTALLEFLGSPRGSDDLRIASYAGLMMTGKLDTESVPLWRNGEFEPAVPISTLIQHVVKKLQSKQRMSLEEVDEVYR
jgi:tetratricopeptide (TPR) repeat protein